MRFLIIEQPDELNQQIWTFELSTDYNPAVRLIRYSGEQKPTKRHKWRVINHWDTYGHRTDTTKISDIPATIVEKLRADMLKWIKEIPVQVR